MTPDQIAKTGSEHSEQAALFAYCACAAQFGFDWADDPRAYAMGTRAIMHHESKPVPVPVLSRLFAIHNQGHGDQIRGAKARAEGVKAGVPDVMLPVPANGAHGLFIELKQRASGKTSAAQDGWIAFLQQGGYYVYVAHGWKAAAIVIRNYLAVQPK